MNLFEAAKTVDILKVYEKYTGETKYKKGRKSIVVKCPFHEDKKPSMNLFPDNGFYCFGCGEHGTSVDLVMKIKGVDASSAAHMICSDFGVKYEDSWKAQPATVRPHGIDADRYFRTNEKLAHAFELYLQSSPNPKYFEQRGLGSLAKEFLFGYCPKGQFFGTSADKTPEERKRQIELAKDMGLGNDAGENVFAGRYMIPIMTSAGQIAGFIGRLPDEEVDDDHPKYLISANSEAFRKRKTFFNQSALYDQDAENVYVVEGVFDALSMIAAGLRKVVCPFGNSLSDEHIDMLRRSKKNVILAFDNDNSGKEATIRALGYARGLRISVLKGLLTGAKDMNDVLIKYGKDDVLSAAGAFQAAPEFIIRDFERNSNLDTLGGQEVLWEKLAKILGSDKPAFENKYPRNLAYTPRSFEYYWGLYQDAVTRHPLSTVGD